MNLIFIFGDQLSSTLPSFAQANKKDDVIFMCEVHAEAIAVKHHKKKIAFLFSAMRHFANSLSNEGYSVCYIKIDDPENTQSFETELERAIKRYNPKSVLITEPSEHRVRELVKAWNNDFDCNVEVLPDDRFLCSPSEFQDWAEGRKQLRMEYFYTTLRRKYNVLMDGDKPKGGTWNYDKDNRSPAKDGLDIPKPYVKDPD